MVLGWCFPVFLGGGSWARFGERLAGGFGHFGKVHWGGKGPFARLGEVFGVWRFLFLFEKIGRIWSCSLGFGIPNDFVETCRNQEQSKKNFPSMTLLQKQKYFLAQEIEPSTQTYCFSTNLLIDQLPAAECFPTSGWFFCAAMCKGRRPSWSNPLELSRRGGWKTPNGGASALELQEALASTRHLTGQVKKENIKSSPKKMKPSEPYGAFQIAMVFITSLKSLEAFFHSFNLRRPKDFSASRLSHVHFELPDAPGSHHSSLPSPRPLRSAAFVVTLAGLASFWKEKPPKAKRNSFLLGGLKPFPKIRV